MSRSRPISDKEYEARWDAESLAKAEEIKADPARKAKAEAAAVTMAEEKRKELTGINRVANRSNRSKKAQQSSQSIGSGNVSRPKTVKRGTGSKTFNVFKKI